MPTTVADSIDIILGPAIDLHTGVHGSLLDSAPAGLTYHLSAARHVFAFPVADESASPYLAPHWGEFVEFGSTPGVVHSARWPVLNRRAWVVDTDDLGFPMLGGRYAFHPEFRRAFHAPWSNEYARNIECRVANMLAAYAHSSCAAVLFRSDDTARTARAWVDQRCEGAVKNAFLRKIHVLYPAQTPCPAGRLLAKWQPSVVPQVVFCGRDYDTKNGRLALEIFGELSKEFPDARFVYVGVIPEAEQRRFGATLGQVRCMGLLDRPRMIALLQESHILFHPSRFESLGIVLMEAAAAGLSLVTATGGGMSHVSDLFDEDTALLVDRDATRPADEPRAFSSRLRALLASPDLARRMAECNHRRASEGRFSLASRDAMLCRVYEDAHRRLSSGPPLTHADLPALAGSRLVTMHSDDVERAYLDACQRLELDAQRVDLREAAPVGVAGREW